jgi:hypothetical protein
MKKFVLVCFLIFSVFCTVFGQEGPIDLILLLDTSSSMSASYRQVNDYMTGSFLREFLRIGDTFHLIPFAGNPRVDISRRIEGRGDVETIIGRMLLQYPLNTWSDIAAALAYAENYAATLPVRPKKIILLTDGDVSPEPGSPSKTLDEAGLQNLIAAAKNRLAGRNTVLEYVKFSPGSPLTNLPSSGRAPMARQPGAPAGPPAGGNQPSPEAARSRPPQTSAGQQQPAAPASGGPPADSPPAGRQSPPPAGQQPGGGTGQLPGQSPGSAPGTPGPSPQTSAPPGGPAESGPGRSPAPAAGSPAPAGSSPAPAAGFPAPAAGSPAPAGSSPAAGFPAPAAGSPAPAESSPAPGSFPPETPETDRPSGTFPGDTGGDVSPESFPQTEDTGATKPAEPPAGTAAPVPEIPASPARPVRPAAQYNRDGFSLPLIIGLAILGLVALGIIIFLVTRRLHGSPRRVMAQAASRRPEPVEEAPVERFTDHSAALASYAANQRPRTGPYTHRYKPQNVDEYEGPLMLNLFVEDQNTFIGKRNIHAVKSGFTFTVGGGKSDFLIFLVPIPPHIGDVRCDGNRCTFIPRKPQYFPDIGSQQVPDCIGKTIRIVSDKNYELHFRLERYEDPLKALNRLLHSVQVPG